MQLWGKKSDLWDVNEKLQKKSELWDQKLEFVCCVWRQSSKHNRPVYVQWHMNISANKLINVSLEMIPL